MITLPPLQGLGIRNVHSATGHTYDLEAEVSVPYRNTERFCIRRDPQEHGMGRVISFHFQSGVQKIPHLRLPHFHPVSLWKGVKTGFCSQAGNSHRALSPGHCVSDECLEAVSWF